MSIDVTSGYTGGEEVGPEVHLTGSGTTLPVAIPEVIWNLLKIIQCTHKTAEIFIQQHTVDQNPTAFHAYILFSCPLP